MCTVEWDTLREHGGFEIHEAARRFLTEFGGLESSEYQPALRNTRSVSSDHRCSRSHPRVTVASL
ncbi:SUKH-3 domain-containing protein [Streptomyces sp. NPDC002784]